MATKRAGEAFFKHIGPKRAPSLFKKMMRSLDSGQYHVPKSFEVLSRFPTEELKLHHSKPLALHLPEHKLIEAFYAKYPEAKLEPVALHSLTPPVAKQFVWRQLELIQQAGGKQEARMQAFQQVEEEMKPVLNQLRRRANMASSHISLLQQEEEVQLRAALDQVAARKAS